jgi:hypothetical protein
MMPLDIFHIFTVMQRGIKPVWVAGTLFIASIAGLWFVQKRPVRFTSVAIALLLFNAAALISALNLVDTGLSQWMDYVTVWVQLVFSTFLVLGASQLSTSDRQVRFLIHIWLGLAFLLSLYALYQVLARPLGWPFGYLPILNPSMAGDYIRGGRFGNFIRPSSVYAEPGFFGEFLLSPLILSWFLWFYHDQENVIFSESTVIGVMCLTIQAAFILSFSLAAWAALAGAILIGAFDRYTREPLLKLTGVMLVSGVVLGFLFQPVLGDNFAEIAFVRTQETVSNVLGQEKDTAEQATRYDQNSAGNRLARARASFDVWWNHPWTGVGLNNHHYYFPDHVAPEAHIGMLMVLSNMGLIGLSGFLCIFWCAFSLLRTLRNTVQPFSTEWLVSTGIQYALWALVCKLMVGFNWVNVELWITLSMLVVVYRWGLENEGDPGDC